MTFLALLTRLWCPKCRALRVMDVIDKRIYEGVWRCRTCHKERNVKLEGEICRA